MTDSLSSPAARAQQDAQIAAIREARARRLDPISTPWEGCEAHPRHGDCAIRLLLAETDRLRQRITEEEQVIVQLRQRPPSHQSQRHRRSRSTSRVKRV